MPEYESLSVCEFRVLNLWFANMNDRGIYNCSGFANSHFLIVNFNFNFYIYFCCSCDFFCLTLQTEIKTSKKAPPPVRRLKKRPKWKIAFTKSWPSWGSRSRTLPAASRWPPPPSPVFLTEEQIPRSIMSWPSTVPSPRSTKDGCSLARVKWWEPLVRFALLKIPLSPPLSPLLILETTVAW